jgi:dihydroneopterin aldolase
LIETLAAQLAGQLLEDFPIHKVEIEVCKFVLPDAKHVAAVVRRNAAGK